MTYANDEKTRVAFDSKGRAVLSFVFTSDDVPTRKNLMMPRAELAPLICEEAIEQHPAVIRAKERVQQAEAGCKETERRINAFRLERQRLDPEDEEAKNREVSPADAPEFALEMTRRAREREASLQRQKEMEEGAKVMQERLRMAEKDVPHQRPAVAADIRGNHQV